MKNKTYPGFFPTCRKKSTSSVIRKRFRLLVLFCLTQFPAPGSAQVELRYEDNHTVTYDEAVAHYRQLDKKYDQAVLLEYGPTDVGKPLHLFVISKTAEFDPVRLKQQGKRIILIMNGIHPGESAGVDASIRFADELLRDVNGIGKYLESTVVCIIPVYSVGGYLNRSPSYRLNQVGPDETGFRGNARNLDLNRDFIKLDTKNAQTFTRLFHTWNPDVFLDTHVTNGSDHQYAITLIATNTQKIHPSIGSFMDEVFVPALYKEMAATPYEMIPYVNWVVESPEHGITGYDDLPRYSTGYASLHNTIGFMTENHAYKEFPDRVKSVYHFMVNLLELTHEHAETIGQVRSQAMEGTSTREVFHTRWMLDTTRHDPLTFKGYCRKTKTGELTGREMNYYDRQAPFTREIPYYRYYKPVRSIEKPDAYLIPQVWSAVIERLKLNGIRMERLPADTIIQVTAYYIEDISMGQRPYNGHFRHSDIKTRSERQEIRFYEGDYLIRTDQPGNRYLVETLEPDCPDSFMSWNFFDPILERREYFSPSTFEKMAADYLEQMPELKMEFEQRKKEDPEFAGNYYAQLRFVYMHSPYLEKSYRRYPVYRLEE